MDYFADLFNVLDDESSAHCEETEASDLTYFISTALYFVTGFATLGLLLYKKLKQKSKMAGMTLAFYIGLIVFMFCRAMWLLIEVENRDKSCETINVNLDYFNKVWNRVCFCIFLFVFQLLLFCWIDTIHTTVNVAFAKDALSGSLDFGFITPLVRNLILFFCILIVIVVFLLGVIRVGLQSSLSTISSSEEYTRRKNAAHDMDTANNLIISLVFLCYGAFLFFYGTKLNCRVHKTAPEKKVEGVWMMEIISILLCACFILRCIMFSLHALFHQDVPGDYFVTFTYTVPELGSAILILMSVNSSMFKNSEPAANPAYDNFQDPLLKEEEDNELFLAGAMD